MATYVPPVKWPIGIRVAVKVVDMVVLHSVFRSECLTVVGLVSIDHRFPEEKFSFVIRGLDESAPATGDVGEVESKELVGGGIGWDFYKWTEGESV